MNDINLKQVARFMKKLHSTAVEDRFNKLKEFYIKEQGESVFTEPGYNIFNLLGVGRDEVNTHSAMIADLLDPAGSHNQEFLFLHAFLNLCQVTHSEPIITEDCSLTPTPFPKLKKDIDSFSWEVHKELRTPKHGQLDIVIKCNKLKFLCVIENKIDADEGGEQLSSYWAWMETQTNFTNSALIFLTSEGRPSESIGCAPYFPMSYQEDIYNWLKGLKPEITEPLVSTIIEQYMELIRTL